MLNTVFINHVHPYVKSYPETYAYVIANNSYHFEEVFK